MKILLTGGTGFLGQHINKRLSDTFHEVVNLSRKLNCDLMDHAAVCNYVEHLNADVLIHLAWDVTHGKYWTSDQNDLHKHASINLFGAFLRNGSKKIIGAGTSAEYPTSSEAVSEGDIVDPNELTPYGRAKREVYEWLSANHDDFTWFRIFGVYGEGENPQRFFPKALEAIHDNKVFPIQTPDAFYDYINVKEIAKFVAWAIDNKGIGAVNIGTGISRSMEEWFEFIKSGYNHLGLQRKVNPNINSRIPNCTKLMKMYGELK